MTNKKVQIVFDNCIDGDMHASLWGFSAYLPEYRLLLDTGSNGRVLLKNIEEKGIDITDIRYLFITHDHWDHTGGIDSVLELNDHLIIYAPYTLSKNYIRDLRSMSKEVIVVERQPILIEEGLYSTGILGRKYPEHSLVIADEYAAVVTGCGHFGVDNIVEAARGIIGRDITEVIGGFHLHSAEETDISSQIERLQSMGIRYATPTHCTGPKASQMFAEVFA
jgi:7,8-dihydropterin-6-yl-methyl-4-(beta-D-ribofuranosyl)aminobenzene 5'-phosphate synthase